MNPLKEGTPEYALIKFIAAWRNQKYDEMLELTQKSWKESVPEPVKLLKALFVYKPESVVIVHMEMKSEVAFEADLKITYQIARGYSKEMPVRAMMIKELDAMVPSPDGTWGVNPASVHVI